MPVGRVLKMMFGRSLSEADCLPLFPSFTKGDQATIEVLHKDKLFSEEVTVIEADGRETVVEFPGRWDEYAFIQIPDKDLTTGYLEAISIEKVQKVAAVGQPVPVPTAWLRRLADQPT